MNTGPARTGTITAGGQIFTVNQSSGCTFILSPNLQDFTSVGGNGNVTITTQPGCSYSSISNDLFITINSGGNGSSSGTLSYTVAANSGAARTGTLFI
jgi:hypothetical protein